MTDPSSEPKTPNPEQAATTHIAAKPKPTTTDSKPPVTQQPKHGPNRITNIITDSKPPVTQHPKFGPHTTDINTHTKKNTHPTKNFLNTKATPFRPNPARISTTTKPAPVTPTKTHKPNDDFTTVVNKNTRALKKTKNKTNTTKTAPPTNTEPNPTSANDDDIDSFNDATVSPDKTLFNILVQVLHPANNNDIHGPMTTTRLHTILTTTFAHHLERVPTLLFTIKNIIYVKSEKRAKPHQNQYAHYFRLILAPNTPHLTPFDPDPFFEQCLAFALQHWHLRSNHQFSISTSSPFADQLITPEIKRPPSTDEWTKHINLLLPAVNNFEDQAKGCLLGIPPDSFGSSRRGCLNILEFLYYRLQPHFPNNKLGTALNADYHTFLEYIGLRQAQLQTFGQKNNQRAPVFFICCYSGDAWTLIFTAAQAAGPFNIHGCTCIIHPFPKPDERPKFIQGANQLAQRLKEMVHVHTDRLLLHNFEDEETLLAQTPHLVAVVPRFVDHAPEAICHTLIFRPSPETVCYTNETLHDALLPPQLLAALPPPTYLATATTAPNQPPPADPSPDVIDSIFSQWDTPPTTEPTDTTVAPSRKRSCANPSSSPDPSTSNDDDARTADTAGVDDEDDSDDDHSAPLHNDTEDDHSNDNSTHMANDNAEDDDAEDESDEESASMTDPLAESDTLLSSSTADDDAIEHALSQTAAAEFKTLEFYVEAHHPDRLIAFQRQLKHAKTSRQEPADIWDQISRWTSEPAEAQFKTLELYVESHHPERIIAFRRQIKHALTTQEEPAALWEQVRSWTTDTNES
jgi:hypothetical protein